MFQIIGADGQVLDEKSLNLLELRPPDYENLYELMLLNRAFAERAAK